MLPFYFNETFNNIIRIVYNIILDTGGAISRLSVSAVILIYSRVNILCRLSNLAVVHNRSCTKKKKKVLRQN